MSKQNAYTDVLTFIGGGLKATRSSQKALAKGIGMTPSTLSRRMQHPEDITLGELWQMRKFFSKRGYDYDGYF